MRRAAAAPAAIVVFLALAGCSADDGEPGSATADCNNQVRYDGTVYTEYAFTTHDATPLGSADRAVCDDTGVPGDPPQGSVFPEDPEQVEVFAIDGYSPDELIGARSAGDRLGVYFAESLSSEEIDRIAEDLGSG